MALFPIVWRSERRLCHGRLCLEADALHLICLADTSAAAAAAVNATGRQFGLIGGLVAGAVAGVRDMSLQKKIDAALAEQAGLSPAEQVAKNPLSRTVARSELTAFSRSRWGLTQLRTSSGAVVLHELPKATAEALATWCTERQVTVETPQPLSLRAKLILFLSPVALVVAYLIAALPFAARLEATVRESLDARDRTLASARHAFDGISGPFGRPFQDACATLAGTPQSEVFAYVGEVLPEAKALQQENYEAFPRFTHTVPAYSAWDSPRLTTDQVEDRWRPKATLGEAYGRIIHLFPNRWGRASRVWDSVADLRAARRVLVARMTGFVAPKKDSYLWTRGHAVLSVQAVELPSGNPLCAGDLAFGFETTSTEPGFILSQAAPMAPLVALCREKDDPACREAAHYAELEALPSPRVAEAPVPRSPPSKPAPARRKRH